jgi:hypothetical protein
LKYVAILKSNLCEKASRKKNSGFRGSGQSSSRAPSGPVLTLPLGRQSSPQGNGYFSPMISAGSEVPPLVTG